jgi:voltage-gated potassium channel
MQLISRLKEIYQGNSRYARRSRYVLLGFDLAVISFFVVTTFLTDAPWIRVMDYVIGVTMTIELLARMLVHHDRLAFLIRPLSLVDILVIFSLLAPAVIGNFAFLRIMRALRLIHSYRVLQEFRSNFRFFARNEEVVFAIINLLVFIFIVSATVFVMQVSINPQINNYIDALYFTITTLTTTGFGDIILIGEAGRLLAVLIMIVGISLFIGLVRSIFRPHKVRYECVDCGLTHHDMDAVHCKHCGALLHIRTPGQ